MSQRESRMYGNRISKASVSHGNELSNVQYRSESEAKENGVIAVEMTHAYMLYWREHV